MRIFVCGDNFLKLGHSHAVGAESGQSDRCDRKKSNGTSSNRTCKDQPSHLTNSISFRMYC